MGDFVTGNRPLPPPKVDAFPPQGQLGELDASDINDIWNALADVRTGIGFPNRTVVSDSDYAVTPTDFLISFTSLTASRTVMLPSASAGLRQIIIKDESGSASETIPISVRAAPGGTVDGTANPTNLSVVIRNFGAAALYSNGVEWRTLYSDRAYLVAPGAIGQSIDSMVLSVFSLNVRWFGAKGDGIHDDTSAIQSALNAATAAINIDNFENLSPAGGPIEVFFPSGLYKVTDTITVQGVVSLRGDGNALTYGGSRIRQYTPGKHLFQIAGISSHDNASIQFRDLGLSSNSSTHAAGTALIYIPDTVVNPASIYIKAMWFQSPEYWSIRSDKCDDLVIEDCTFDISTERAISLGSATGLVSNAAIARNYFFNITTGIVKVVNVKWLVFSDNRINGNAVQTGYIMDALNGSPVAADSIVAVGNVSYKANGLLLTKFGTVTLTGNVIRSGTSPLVQLAGGGTIGNVVIAGNVLSGVFTGSAAIDGSGAAVQYASITGNSFTGIDGVGGPAGTGILLTGGSSANNKVVGNAIFGFSTAINVSDTTSNVEYVDLGTAQTVAGIKTFSSQVRTPGIDTATATTLLLGTSNANAIQLGNGSVVTTALGGMVSPAFDANTAANLNIGTTSATTVTLGKAGVTASAPGGYRSPSLDTATAVILGIGQTNASAILIGKAGQATTFLGASVANRTLPTWGANIAVDASQGNYFEVVASTNVAHNFNAPTNPSTGQRITYKVKNTSGGVLGAGTWNAVFKMLAWTPPTSTNNATISFVYDGTNWVQDGPQSVNVPN